MQLEPEHGMLRETYSEPGPAPCLEILQQAGLWCKSVVAQSELQELLSVKLSFYTSMKYFDFFGLWDTQCFIIAFSASGSDAVLLLWVCCHFD